MPLLPTLFTVVVLGAASMYCTKHDAPAPAAAARMIPAEPGASLAMTAPAAPAAEPAARPPAVIAFSEAFPLAAEPTTTSALPAAVVPSRAASRPSRRIASSRRPCPGKRCQDNAVQETSTQESASQENPFRAARTASEDQESSPRIPSALPFAESVVEAVVPVAREVGAGIGTKVERITTRAGEWVQGGQSVVKGSVSVLSDRLF